MKFSGTFPIVCLVSFGVFVLSLAGISVLLHTEPPVSGSILTVPLAFVIALAIAAPAFLVFAITGIAMLLHPIQKSNEKEAKKNNSAIIKGYDKPSEFPIEMIDDNAPEKIENHRRENL